MLYAVLTPYTITFNESPLLFIRIKYYFYRTMMQVGTALLRARILLCGFP